MASRLGSGRFWLCGASDEKTRLSSLKSNQPGVTLSTMDVKRFGSKREPLRSSLEKRVSSTNLPSILDREIDSVDRDAFGHRHFAEALRDLIESPENKPPFSIGLLGSWGIGKSTIKKLYLTSLEQDVHRRHRIRCITFNAWRYGGGDIKRALLRHVWLELGGDEQQLLDALFSRLVWHESRIKSFREILRDLAVQVGLAFFPLLLWLALCVLTWYYTRAELFSLVTSVVSGLLLRYFVSRQWYDLPYKRYTREESPRTAVEQYEQLLFEQIRRFKNGSGKKCERLVIFVDDLDRLTADEMVSGLDAIRAFMDLSAEEGRLASLGIVFVVSCDEERIARALAGRARSESPGTVFSREDARRYLDRIFQFRLEIPSPPRQDLRGFAEARLREVAPALVSKLEQVGVFDRVIDRLIHVGVQTPRHVIQLLNAFIQSWWIAEKREFEGTGTNRAGGLREGDVTGHPEALAALCTLRVDFPDFFERLQHEPRLIDWFTDVFVRGNDYSKQPPQVQEALKPYYDADHTQVKPEYRPLLRYITSLDGLAWPERLQPLLLLSQDAITRRYGDRANRIYDALVSGDAQGVLVELGYALDTRPLAREDVLLLRGLEEQIREDTPVRRDNAAAAIAGLIHRLPEADAHLLLTPMVRRLAESETLRWRVGLPTIREALAHVHAEEQRPVAERLIDDLLLLEGEIRFRLPGGAVPSLDEAVDLATEAASIVLWVWHSNGLSEQYEKKLLSWLLDRRVAVEGREAAVPFRRLEEWMGAYEDRLISKLGASYAEQVLELLEEDQIEDLDQDAIPSRCRKILVQLLESGEEGRRQLWDLLCRYAAVRLPSAVAVAREFMVEHVSEVPATVLSKFIEAFAERLRKDIDEDEWQIPTWDQEGEGLLTLLVARGNEVGEGAYDVLVELGKAWSAVKETGQLATALAEQLAGFAPEHADELLLDWCNRVLDDLCTPCVQWLAQVYLVHLNDDHRNKLVSSFQAIITNHRFERETLDRYDTFLQDVPPDAMSSPPLESHFRQLLQNVPQRYTNAEYVQAIIPVILKYLERLPADSVGEMLQNLLVRVYGQDVGLFAWLHEQLTGKWPAPRQEFGPYNPEQLFDNAIDIIRRFANQDYIPSILSSVCDMVKRDIVSYSRVTQVLEAACAVWPYFPDRALPVLLAFDTPPPRDEQIVSLAARINLEAPEVADSLLAVWKHIAGLLDSDRRLQVTRLLLQDAPSPTSGDPDSKLRLWVEAQGDDKASLLLAALRDASLNDDQRRRVWSQAERFADELGLEFFVEVIPDLLAADSGSTTARAIFEARDTIDRLATTSKDRYRLAEALLKGFQLSKSLEVKRQSLDWLRSLRSTRVLRDIDQDRLTEDDIQLLKEYFGGSRFVRRLGQRG